MVAPAAVDPIEARKQELLADPDFAKFVRAYKNRVPLLAIRNQIRAAGMFDPDDLLMFASANDIANLKKTGDYKGDKY